MHVTQIYISNKYLTLFDWRTFATSYRLLNQKSQYDKYDFIRIRQVLLKEKELNEINV